MTVSDGPNFARLRRALLREGEPDRVPLMEIGVDRDVKRAFLGERRRSGLAGEVQFWAEAGYDYVPLAVGINMVVAGNIPPRDAAGAAFSQAMRPREEKYSLYREQETQRRWMEEGQGLITSMEDFNRFPWPSPKDIDCSIVDAIGQHLPPGMKVIPLVGNAFHEVCSLIGVEAFFLAVYENPELVAAVFDKVSQLDYEALRQVVEKPSVGAVWLVGDMAYNQGLMVSPRFLRQYVFPLMKEMAALCHRYELPCLFHSDGNLTEVVDDIIDCGIDALHPIEPPGMDIVALKQKYGRRLCLCGNIDMAYTLTLATPEEVAEEVKQRLRQVAPGGGYCAGSANSITEYVPLANYNAMRETVLRYGRYPISV